MSPSDERAESRLLGRVARFNSRTNRFYRKWTRKAGQRTYYRQQLDTYLAQSSVAVHLGAGGKDPASLTSLDLTGKTIHAVDCSLRSLERNPNPNKIVAWAHAIPLRTESVDLVFSEYLMEHVSDPEATVAESARILRPGGRLIWMAPNLWSYQGLLTKLTPFRFHRWVNQLLQPVTPRRASADVFPTYLRLNSISRIRRTLARAGLELEECYTVADAPHYTQFLPGVHQLAVMLHLLLDRYECLRHFRMVQIVRARKPTCSPDPT